MRRIPIPLCGLALVLVASPAAADALIERYTRSQGLGGLGGFESTTVQTTSATAQREETQLRFTGGFLGALQKMAGFGDSVRITRLDRELVWTLDPQKRTFTEQPLSVRGERQRAMPGTRPPREGGQSSDVVITRNEFTVEKTGATKTINGFPREEYLVTWIVETRNEKTGETGKSTMTDRLWTTTPTPEIESAEADAQAYTRAYLAKLGLDMTPAEAQKYLAGLTGLGEEAQRKALARVAAEFGKVRGYTIASQLDWTAEGKGGAPAAGTGTAGGGGAGAGGQPGLGQLAGQLARLFGAKPGSGADGGQPAGQSGGQSSGQGAGSEAAPGGHGAIFSLYTEVKSIRAVPADPARFEVPGDYTRKSP